MHLRSVVGVVELRVWQGKDPRDGHWGCPVRESWGLKAHQQMSPALEEKLVFTASLAGSYEAAAQLAAKWGSEVDDSVIHGLVQRVGSKAEAQTQERLRQVPEESQPRRKDSELAVLMMDGWHVRFRGPGWGRKRTRKERVEWHEMKMGVFYLHEQAGVTESGRGMICDKRVVRWVGEPGEFGRRLHWEAQRGGLSRAQNLEVLADGGVWIWNLAQDRWAGAIQVLDFYHGSEHLWEVGRAVHGQEEAQAKPWVERGLHQLRHGQEQVVLKEIAALQPGRGRLGRVVRKEQNYFAAQAGRMNYQAIAKRGWPIGSGAVESACRQSQRRFKGPGQFWTQAGLRHLCAVDEPRQNNHWDELWQPY